MKITPRTRNLLVANGVLVAMIAGIAFANRAGAQESVRQIDARARGDYTMVAGASALGGPSVVYVVDSSNQEIVALKWDNSKQSMSGVGYRNLQNDARSTRGR